MAYDFSLYHLYKMCYKLFLNAWFGAFVVSGGTLLPRIMFSL